MRNLFVKTALVLCTTIIFLPATVFATEPQNTEITSAEEGFVRWCLLHILDLKEQSYLADSEQFRNK